MKLSDKSTAKFEIELVNKQVQKIKQTKKDCQTHYGKQLGFGAGGPCKALQLCVCIDELVDTIEAMRKHIETLQQENKHMKKAMLSQPMAGKTDEEIVATRNAAIKTLEAKGYEVINTLFTNEWHGKEQTTTRGIIQIPLYFLAKSLKNMSLCHAVYFCKGWKNARECRIEHEAAIAYGLELLYEN